MRALGRCLTGAALLLAVDYLDELWSAVPSLSAPALRLELGLSYSGLSAVLFTVPMAVAMCVEPLLLLWLARRPRRQALAASMFVLGLGAALGALATGPLGLLASMICSYLASGAVVTLAQTALMDADPERRELWMTRWTLMGALGDLSAPVLFMLLAGWELGWRSVFGLCALACVLHTLLLVCVEPSALREAGHDDLAEPPLSQLLRQALRRRELWLWLCAAVACDFLDELLVAFGALHLRDVRGFDAAARSSVFFAFSAGASVGLLLGERLLRWIAPLRLLALSSAFCALAYVAWLHAPTPGWSGLWLFLVGLSVAPHYPVVQAQAYRAWPGEAVLVSVLGGVLQPLSLCLPLCLGFVADRVGLGATLWLLVLQPMVLLGVALWALRR